MRPIDSQRGRRVTLKRLFEVSVNADADLHSAPDTLIALADDEKDVRSLAEIRSARIVKLVALPGLVTAIGPSRVIGWTTASSAAS